MGGFFAFQENRMTIRSGINAQWGFDEESAWGTGVTPTRFLPFISEKVNQNIARIESKSIRVGRRVIDSSSWAAGDITIAGQIQTEVYDRNMGLLFKHMFGAVTTSGAGPYAQTYTPGDLTGKSLTMQFGRPGVAGTVHPFTYAGCKISKWQLQCSVNQFVTLGLDITAKSLDASLSWYRRQKADGKGWQDRLIRNTEGELEGITANAITILRNDAAWAGVLAWDDFAQAITFRSEPPWYDDDRPAEESGVPTPI